MRDSGTSSLRSPLAVVAHDAGAANLIIAWLKERPDLVLRLCLDGPAAGLWSAAFPVWRNDSLMSVLDGAAMLLSGTGWASDLEHEARRVARARQVRSIAVIDHWVNYCERFVRAGEQVLPDELWVADEYARAEAGRVLPGVPLRQLANFYLDGLVREIAVASLSARAGDASVAGARVLYVLEPIRQHWGAAGQPGEFQALEFFLQNLGQLDLGPEPEIRLRLHPSEAVGKYSGFVRSHPGFKLSVDAARSLAESIAWADCVAGCQSFAMVVALQTGRRVISTNPLTAPRCSLPHRGIQHLRDLVADSP